MSDLFNLDDSLFDIYRAGIDALIDQIGKNVKLIYPPKIESCTNCVYDPIGRRSANVYRSGGPAPFVNGSICPMCGGQGTRQTSYSEVIKMLVEWNPQDFDTYGLSIRDSKAICSTKCHAVDMPKIQRAVAAIIDSDQEAIARQNCVLLGKPLLRGLKISTYCQSFWQLVNVSAVDYSGPVDVTPAGAKIGGFGLVMIGASPTTPSTSSTSLNIHGWDTYTESVNLFIESVINSSGITSLYTNGLETDNGSTDLFIEAPSPATPVNEATQLYTKGLAPETGTTNLFVNGLSLDNVNTQLYTKGLDSYSESTDMYISGSVINTESTDLFMHGLDSDNESTNLYIFGFIPGEFTPYDDEIPLYISGPIASSVGLDLCTQGHTGDSDSTNLYISGLSDLFDSTDLYAEGHIPDVGSTNLFINGLGLNSVNTNLFVQGLIEDTNNTDLYIKGLLADAESTDLYIQGSVSDSQSTNLYVGGLILDNKNIDLYIGGLMSDFESIDLYTQGPITIDETTQLFIEGDVSGPGLSPGQAIIDLTNDGVLPLTPGDITDWDDATEVLETFTWTIGGTPVVQTYDRPADYDRRVNFPTSSEIMYDNTISSADATTISAYASGTIFAMFRLAQADASYGVFSLSNATASSNDGAFLWVDNHKLKFNLQIDNTTDEVEIETNDEVLANNLWYRAAICQDGDSISVWLNGEEKTITETLNGSALSSDWLTDVASANSDTEWFDQVALGAWRAGTSNIYTMASGDLVDVKFYPEPLSDADLATLTAPTNELYFNLHSSGLVPQTSGAALTDWVESEGNISWNSPTIIDTPMVQSSGLPAGHDYYAQFARTGAHTGPYLHSSMTSAEASGINTHRTGTMFVTARWYNTQTNRSLFSVGNISNSAGYWNFRESNRTIYVYSIGTGGSQYRAYKAASFLDLNEWHTIGIRQDGSGIQMWVDGTEFALLHTPINGAATQSDWLQGPSHYQSDLDYGDRISIARLRNGGGAPYAFNGDIAKIEYYHGTFTDDEMVTRTT